MRRVVRSPGRRLELETLENRLAPANLIVNTLSDNTASDSLLTLREAIAVVNSGSTAGLSAAEMAQVSGTLGDYLHDPGQRGDTIYFDEPLEGTITLSAGELTLIKAMTIRGPGADVITIDAHQASRVFNTDDGISGSNFTNFNIIGLTIANGRSTAGGNILNNENLNLDSVEIIGGSTTAGGMGGGVLNAASGNRFEVYRSTFTGNQADGDGGAIAGNVYAQSSTFFQNRALGSGSAISGGVALLGCTVVSNTADFDNNGSGARALDNTAANGSINNTIVANNLTGLVQEDIGTSAFPLSGSANLIGDAASSGPFTSGVNRNIVGNNGTGTLPLASILSETLALNGAHVRTLALVQNSPAIGAANTPGDVNFGWPFDQRQVAFDQNAPDIGAYEVQHPLTPVGVPSQYSRTFLPKPSPDANTAFVKGLYQSTLLRDPDAAGLAGWVNALNSGANRTAVAYDFINSTESRTRQVTFFYQYFLDRLPDGPGLAGWVSALQSGVSEATVMTGFILSPEFSGRTTNAGFVNLMYYAILGRQAEPAGFNAWMNQLGSGEATRADLVNGFLNSVESITRVVQSDFASYLKRKLLAEEATPYVAQIQSGVTFGRVAANLVGSDEFFAAATQNQA